MTAAATTTANAPSSAVFRNSRQADERVGGEPAGGSGSATDSERVRILSSMDWRVISSSF
ncbi:hypothetical protein CK214_04685 [Mesorhizobium sp. WSM3882]|nr:hypothetical protein CK214_04685 [Mesorhizobium sp. WSM3882]